MTDLRERVARAICARLNMHFDYIGEKLQAKYLAEADAAIAIVLEEAAKECEQYADKDWKLGEGFRNKAALDLAAAIRAMKEGENG